MGCASSVDIQGRSHDFVTSFCGVVQDGHLLRIWGVARDITELDRPQCAPAARAGAAEDVRAAAGHRRGEGAAFTAVDLHDGIGQTLVGMAMTLDVARQHAPSDVALLVDEVRARLRDVQERTRQMITDLSPPGLYDLGLVPALQWLAVYMRGHDRLSVELDARGARGVDQARHARAGLQAGQGAVAQRGEARRRQSRARDGARR